MYSSYCYQSFVTQYKLYITSPFCTRDKFIQSHSGNHLVNKKKVTKHSEAIICDGVIIYTFMYISNSVGWVAQSVWRLTTGWTVRDRIPVGTRFSAHPDRPWDPPRLLCNGYQVFPRSKVRPGRGADQSPPSTAAVTEE